MAPETEPTTAATSPSPHAETVPNEPGPERVFGGAGETSTADSRFDLAAELAADDRFAAVLQEAIDPEHRLDPTAVRVGVRAGRALLGMYAAAPVDVAVSGGLALSTLNATLNARIVATPHRNYAAERRRRNVRALRWRRDLPLLRAQLHLLESGRHRLLRRRRRPGRIAPGARGGVARLNVWECQHRGAFADFQGCERRAYGLGGAVGLRAIGWYYQPGPEIFCPEHHPLGAGAALAQAKLYQLQMEPEA